MLPVVGPITPYRRLCGSAFLALATAVAPNLHFAMLLSYSPSVAQASVWALFGLYVAGVFIPRLQNVSQEVSFAALLVAAVIAALALGFSAEVKHAIAGAIGFYDDELPWVGAHVSGAESAYQNPNAGYSLHVPAAWHQRPGPIAGTTELILKRGRDSSSLARLRPSCAHIDEPLPVRVADLLGRRPQLARSCGRWRGMEACLLVERSAESSGVTWQWLGNDVSRGLQIRLTVEVFSPSATRSVLAVINSLEPAPPDFPVAACPHPIAWAAPF